MLIGVVGEGVEEEWLLRREAVRGCRARAGDGEAGPAGADAVRAGRVEVVPLVGEPPVGAEVHVAGGADGAPGGAVMGDDGGVGPLRLQGALAVGAGAVRHAEQRIQDLGGVEEGIGVRAAEALLLPGALDLLGEPRLVGGEDGRFGGSCELHGVPPCWSGLSPGWGLPGKGSNGEAWVGAQVGRPSPATCYPYSGICIYTQMPLYG